MASSQQGMNVTQVMEKEKAKLDEMMRDAKKNLPKDEIIAARSTDQFSALAVCHLYNAVTFQSRFHVGIIWSGNLIGALPRRISSGDRAIFVTKGSKGAVVYGSHTDNPTSAAWLLAWSKPADTTQPIRVYVEAGTRERLVTESRWQIIEGFLDEAGENSEATDEETGAYIFARISNDTDMNNVAVVFAQLTVWPPRSIEG